MFDTAPDDVEGWIRLAAQSKRLSELAASEKLTLNLAWSHAGFAVECTLKACIMAQERFNKWPDRVQRPDLHTHDLSKLLGVLGEKVDPSMPVAPHWWVAVSWRREHMYVANTLPEPVVKGLMASAFEKDGIIEWLSRKYLKNYLKAAGSIFSS